MDMKQYEIYHETKHHGDFTFPYDTYLCSIPLDFEEVPLHWHEEFEILYIKKGQGIVTINLIQFPVESGSILFILPGQLHAIYGDSIHSLEYENIIFHPSLLSYGKSDCCNHQFLQPLFTNQISIPAHISPAYKYYLEISDILNKCDEIGATKPIGYPFYIKSQLFYLFYILQNRCQTVGPAIVSSKALERLKPVLKYIELEYANDISIEEAAKQAMYSPSHFMRCFKNTFHCTFIEYLTDYRLTMSIRLLNTTEQTILEIAECVGFDSLSYYNRVFKKKYGMTPGQYRRTSQPARS